MVHQIANLPRDKIEVVCFSLNPNPKRGVQGDSTMDWHDKMVSACDGNFHDISALSYSAAALAINHDGPNVLVNLDGWTSAPLINEIFILAPAPVQVGDAKSTRVPPPRHLISSSREGRNLIIWNFGHQSTTSTQCQCNIPNFMPCALQSVISEGSSGSVISSGSSDSAKRRCPSRAMLVPWASMRSRPCSRIG